jgi:hypothetical protein
MDLESEPVDNDTHGWVELDISALRPEDGTRIPFRLIANRVKSSSPDSERFIHDPLRALLEAQETDTALQELQLTPDWRVTTLVVNHHQTLSATHLYMMAAVDPDEQTVGITLVKQGG